MKTRDAETLARLLDGDRSVNGEADASVREMAALAQAIEARASAPRAEFKEALRARLMAEATAPPPPTWLARLRDGVERTLAPLRYSARMGAASAIAALTLSTGGVAAATQMSVPGDLFYPVKVALEDARVARATTTADQGSLLLGTAETRLGEAEDAVARERFAAAAVALDHADATTRQAADVLLTEYLESGDPQAYWPLLDFIEAASPRLDRLAGGLPAGADVERAAAGLRTTFERIEARIDALAGGCCPQAIGGATPGTPQPGVGFDFARIPPADEPFDPCPCPPARDAAPVEPAPAIEPDDLEAPPPPAPAPDPTRQPEPAPAPPPGPDDGGNGNGNGPLPDPERILDDPVDAVEDIIDDLLDELPIDRPSNDGPTDRLRDELRDTLDSVDDTVEDTTGRLRDILP